MPRKLSAHDAEVLRVAESYYNRGYAVWADNLADYDYPQPKTIGGYIPDVYAKERPEDGRVKPTHVLVEVDTKNSQDDDQLWAFFEWEMNKVDSFHKKVRHIVI